MAKLEEYNSTNAFASSLMENIKRQYADRQIQNIQTAVSAMESLKINNFNEFSKKFATIEGKKTAKQTKLKTARDKKTAAVDAELAQVVKVLSRPEVKTKNWETEAPSTEIIFQKNIKTFEEAWKIGKKLLIKAVEQRLTQKQPNLKLFIGIEYTMIEQKVDMDDQDPDDINLLAVGKPREVVAKTKHVNVYSVDSVKQTILNLRTELETKFWNGLENQVGSNWAIDRIKSLFAHTHTLKNKTGSSYIPTPPRYAAPKCGLINIRNTDQRCFKYCMLYHQSQQTKHNHATTALDKIEDQYDYGTMTFPASLKYKEHFEEDNKLTINICKIHGAMDVVALQDGNVEHCRNGMVNLLHVEDGDQAH
jgi:hypothetical protein